MRMQEFLNSSLSWKPNWGQTNFILAAKNASDPALIDGRQFVRNFGHFGHVPNEKVREQIL